MAEEHALACIQEDSRSHEPSSSLIFEVPRTNTTPSEAHSSPPRTPSRTSTQNYGSSPDQELVLARAALETAAAARSEASALRSEEAAKQRVMEFEIAIEQRSRSSRGASPKTNNNIFIYIYISTHHPNSP